MVRTEEPMSKHFETDARKYLAGCVTTGAIYRPEWVARIGVSLWGCRCRAVLARRYATEDYMAPVCRRSLVNTNTIRAHCTNPTLSVCSLHNHLPCSVSIGIPGSFADKSCRQTNSIRCDFNVPMVCFVIKSKKCHFSSFPASHNNISRGMRGTSWHSNMCENVSNVVLCSKRNISATVSQDAQHLSWQTQHFGDLQCHFALQGQRFRRVVRIALSALRETQKNQVRQFPA